MHVWSLKESPQEGLPLELQERSHSVSSPQQFSGICPARSLNKLPQVDIELQYLLQYRRLQPSHVGKELKQAALELSRLRMGCTSWLASLALSMHSISYNSAWNSQSSLTLVLYGFPMHFIFSESAHVLSATIQ